MFSKRSSKSSQITSEATRMIAESNKKARKARGFMGVETLEGRQMMSASTAPVTIGTLAYGMSTSDAAPEVYLNTSTVMNAAPGAGQVELPTTYPYYIQIDHEVMKVTQQPVIDAYQSSGAPEVGFIMCVRGADGTAWVSHPVNEPVQWLPNYLAAAHLPAPTGLNATPASSTQVNLTWNEVDTGFGNASGFSSYDIQEQAPGSSTPFIATNVSSNTQATSIPSLTANSTYSFRIRANNDAGPGDWSAWVTVTTPAAATNPVQPPAGQLGAPKNLHAVAVSTSQINLSWTAGANATSATKYLVYYCTATSGWQVLDDTSNTTDGAINLAHNTTYYFDVFAHNGNTYTTDTGIANATTFADQQLPPPTGLAAKTFSSSQVNLSWNAVQGADTYIVQVQMPGGGWTTVGTTSGTSLPVTALPAASTDYFHVAAQNSQESSQYSGAVSALTCPAAPSNFKAQAVSSSQVNLSWDAVPSITGYVVAYKNASTNWTYKYLAVGQTSYAVTGLDSSVDYTFYVCAYNASGPTWAHSIDAVTAVTGPTTPTGFKATAVSGNQLNLTWNAAAGANSYIVYYWANNQWNTLTTTGSTSQMVTVSGSGTYYFDIIAGNGTGQYSSAAQYISINM